MISFHFRRGLTQLGIFSVNTLLLMLTIIIVIFTCGPHRVPEFLRELRKAEKLGLFKTAPSTDL